MPAYAMRHINLLRYLTLSLSPVFLLVYLLQFSAFSMAMYLHNWMLYSLKVKCDNSPQWHTVRKTTGRLDCGKKNGMTIVRGTELTTNGCRQVALNRVFPSDLINLHKRCVHLPAFKRVGWHTAKGKNVSEEITSASINGFPTAAYFYGL